MRYLAHVLAGASMIMACGATPEAVTSRVPPTVVDHHVHILGPGLLQDWKSLGVTFSREDDAYTSATHLAGEGRIDGAILVPMAHLYGNDEFREALGISADIEQRRVSAENDHVAQEAVKHDGRAVAFCSVNYLRPYAWDELHRCRSELGSAGIKLHLANAGTDLRDPEHLTELERVISWAEGEGLAVLLHFDPQRRGLEVEDVDTFIRVVLDPHPDLDIQIAHLGGSGGYGEWTRAVFLTFASWLEEESRDGRPRSGVTFDLAAVILEEESEGIPATTDEEAEQLADDLRRAGLELVVFGSDYPVFDPAEYAAVLARRSGLTESELAIILENRRF